MTATCHSVESIYVHSLPLWVNTIYLNTCLLYAVSIFHCNENSNLLSKGGAFGCRTHRIQSPPLDQIGPEFQIFTAPSFY